MNTAFKLRRKKEESEDASTQQAENLVFKVKTDQKRPNRGQLRYFFRLLNKGESLTAWIAVVVLVVAAPVLVARGYFNVTEVVPMQGGEYVEALVGTPQYINPLLSSLSDVDSDIGRLVFSGLFRETDQQTLEYDLITNYTISDDELTYTFYLRSDVKWHDGDPLTADDVLFTIGSIQDTQYQSPLASALTGVDAEKIDDYSFSLVLPEPFAPFLSSLTFGILPQHKWYDVPAQNFRLTELNVRPIGSGPYKFKELVKDGNGNMKSYTLEVNTEYYDTQANIQDITFLFYPDITGAVVALQKRQVEGLAFFPQADLEPILDSNKNASASALRIPQYTAVFFNQKQSDVLTNDTVRKALATSVDRGGVITDALNGAAEPIYSAILPGYVGHNPEVEKYEYDLIEANRLLEEDGWVYPTDEELAEREEKAAAAEEAAAQEEEAATDEEAESTEGADGEESTADSETDTTETTPVVEEVEDTTAANDDFVPREKDGQKLEFTIATVDLPEYFATLSVLQERWEQIGAKVNVDLYSAQDIQTLIIKKRDYEALLFGQIVGSDPDPYAFWHSSQQTHPGLALSIFRDKEVDQLLDEARKTNDDNERRLKYLHFQNNIADEIPAIFLYNPQYNYAVHEKVQGIHPDQYIAVPSDRFAGITSWYIKTKRVFK